jgi:hypothetical protein
MNDSSLENEFERRASERTPQNRGALLRIAGLKDLFALTLRDASDRGVGMLTYRSAFASSRLRNI